MCQDCQEPELGDCETRSMALSRNLLHRRQFCILETPQRTGSCMDMAHMLDNCSTDKFCCRSSSNQGQSMKSVSPKACPARVPNSKRQSILHLEMGRHKHNGSWRESGEVCVLRGFPESDEFGSRGGHPLRLQQQVVEVAVAASAFEQRSDIAVDCLHHSQPHLGPAVVQDSLQVA
jgi:hypothetical protein